VLAKLFPRSLDNSYSGYKIALWILGLVIALRALQSTLIIVNGYTTAIGADGIPLDTYPPDAVQTILALFAIGSLWRLLFSVLGAIVLIRYRSAMPLILALMVLQFLAAQLLSWFIPLVRVGTPPGVIVNLIQFGLIVVALVLSLMNRRVNESQMA